MGGWFSTSSKQYNLDDHGHKDRARFDDYIDSEGSNKFRDLSGKVVAITGTSTGSLGFHLAEVAVKKKASLLLLLNRSSSKGAQKGFDDLKAMAEECGSSTTIKAIPCDLQEMSSVETAAEELKEAAMEADGLDVLILNAGIMATRDTRTKADGFDVQMQTNQLSHFFLTYKVWDALVLAGKNRGDARLVTHSSSARDTPSAMLEEQYFHRCPPGSLGGDDRWAISELLFGYAGPWRRYHMSKLANSTFAMALHDKLRNTATTLNVRALSADPGVASSNLQVRSTEEGLMSGWLAKMLMSDGHSAEDGSLCAAMAAYSDEAESGDFYAPEKGAKGAPVKTIRGGAPDKSGKERLTCSVENQRNVWKWCEDALSIQFVVQ